MPKYFEYLSRLQYVFHGLAVFLIVANSLIKSQGSVSRVGLGVAFLGIGFTVGSLSDIREVTRKEAAIFSNPRRFKLQTRGLLGSSCLVFCASILFLSIGFINASMAPALAAQYTNLGYGCVALTFGSFFELKQVFEKRRVFELREGEGVVPHL